MTALVLSGSYTETNRFAKQKKLGYGIRHVVSAANLEGRRPTSIHILPSYYDRRDIHAVKAAMKHVFRHVGRSVPVIEYDIVEVAADGSDDVIRKNYVARVDGEQAGLTQNHIDLLVTPPPAPDESKDAVPGQISLEEALAEPVPDRLEALQALADEVEEPESLASIVLEAVKEGDITPAEIVEATEVDEDVPDWMKS